MKNADHLLRQIMDEVDTNRDGKIQYKGEPARCSQPHAIVAVVPPC